MPEKKILIVQENPRERMEMVGYLENLGFAVEGSFDGIEAEKILDKKFFGMVIVDLSIPDFSAVNFLRYVKQRTPETEVMFLSENPAIEEAVEVMKEGAFDFIIKPLDKEQLKLSAKRAFLKVDRTESSDNKDLSSKKPVEIITQDKEMQRLLVLAERVADSSASVLIQGESGTGKELFARFIHEKSSRKNMPFVAVNCAALPEALLESELFGHEKGAFTGAFAKKPGKFELAHKGTILLDEISEMPFHLQAKLLRVLQEKQIDRIGGTEPVDVNVRVIATTNKFIKESIEKGEFREDLYYRLNTIPLVIPPLRERREDLMLLADYFLKKYSILDARPVKTLTKQAFEILSSQNFPGNVRELENIIHRALLISEEDYITPADLLIENQEEKQKDSIHGDLSLFHGLENEPLKKIEEKVIFHTLDKTEGNRTHAAKILGISVRTLRNKLNEYKKQQS